MHLLHYLLTYSSPISIASPPSLLLVRSLSPRHSSLLNLYCVAPLSVSSTRSLSFLMYPSLTRLQQYYQTILVVKNTSTLLFSTRYQQGAWTMTHGVDFHAVTSSSQIYSHQHISTLPSVPRTHIADIIISRHYMSH